MSVVCTAKNSQGFGVDLIYSIFAQREAFAFVFFFNVSTFEMLPFCYWASMVAQW